jgi:hypothetical protein
LLHQCLAQLRIVVYDQDFAGVRHALWAPRLASAVNLKFLSSWPPARLGTSNSKPH